LEHKLIREKTQKPKVRQKVSQQMLYLCPKTPGFIKRKFFNVTK